MSIEKHLPITLAVITFFLLIFFFHIDIDVYLDNLLSNVITFSSIIIGFVGVLLAVLFSLRATNTVELLFKNKKQEDLKRYFTRSIASGVFVVCISICLYLRKMFYIYIIKDITITRVLGAMWGATIVYLILATYILLDIIMCVIFTDTGTHGIDKKKVKNQARADMEKKYSMNKDM